jgi:hypothetical protein
MSRPDLVSLGRLCLRSRRPESRPLAAHCLPGRADRFPAADSCGMTTESPIEPVAGPAPREAYP